MNFETLFLDKSTKPKEKIEALSAWLKENSAKVDDLINFESTAKPPIKASCIEALEYVTNKNPEFGTKRILDFVVQHLDAKEPRIKWESAKVIGNIAPKFSGDLDTAIIKLIANTEDPGTVVRWATAFALGEILKLKTTINATLIPTLENICNLEEKNSIKKIYLTAIKAANK